MDLVHAMTIGIKFLRHSHGNPDISSILSNYTASPFRYIIIPDNFNIEDNIKFKLSRYTDRCYNTVIAISVTIDTDVAFGDYIRNEYGIYSTRSMIAPTIPLVKIIAVAKSNSLSDEIFNSDISDHKLCICHDGENIIFDGTTYILSDVIFDVLTIDNVFLLHELKKLNVLTFDI